MRNLSILVGGLLALVFILAAPPAHANGQAMVECDNCTTVSGFRQEARGLAIQWNLPVGNYLFAVLNQQDKLLGQIKVIRDYEGELGRWITGTVMLTSSLDAMSSAFQVAVPDLDSVDVPTSVAMTFTGTSQADAVAAFLHNHFAGTTVNAGETVRTIFADGSGAVYRLADFSAQSWAFASGSGFASDGAPLADDGSALTYTRPPATVLTPIKIQLGGHEHGEVFPLPNAAYEVQLPSGKPVKICFSAHCMLTS